MKRVELQLPRTADLPLPGAAAFDGNDRDGRIAVSQGELTGGIKVLSEVWQDRGGEANSISSGA
jgi:hypothetical protein